MNKKRFRSDDEEFDEEEKEKVENFVFEEWLFKNF